jgi:hypothetical protein
MDTVELVNIHVPKTAGSSFRKILSQLYKPEEIFDYYVQDSVTISVDPIQADTKVINGHFCINGLDGLFLNAKRVTWLRHPVMRVISHYCYWKSFEGASPDSKHVGILEFAEDQQNLMTLHTTTNLSNFYFVGIQEFFADDLNDLGKILQWPKLHVYFENRNKFPHYYQFCQRILNNIAVIEQILAFNQQDMELYEAALNLRTERRDELKPLHQFYIYWQRTQLKINQIQDNSHRVSEDLREAKKQFQKIENRLRSIQNFTRDHCEALDCLKQSTVDEEDVYYCYQLLLNREPDQEGMQYWINRIDNEKLLITDLVSSFLDSHEFKQLYLNGSSDHFSSDFPRKIISESIAKTYIYYCYRFLAEQAPSKAEEEFWLKEICNNQLGVQEMVLKFLQSFKYKNLAILD